jgi:uncharacterized protein involved in cysteine biosynthesis
MGRAPQHLRDFFLELKPLPPKAARWERLLYGLAQPLIGARMVLRDRELLKVALVPVLLLGLFCAAIALLKGLDSPEEVAARFYRTFAVLAPLPSIVFARHYARLAAASHQKLGFGECKPRIEGLGRVIRRAVYQALLVALAAAPVVVVFRLVPVLGRYLAQIALVGWGLHWVIIGSFDDARILESGQTLADVDAENAAAPQAWFVRGYYWLSNRLTGLGKLIRFIARRFDKMSFEWREEMEVAESHPVLVTGFGLTTAALLATPVLNLFFRPIIIVASVHLLGQLAREEEKAVADNSSELATAS